MKKILPKFFISVSLV